MTANEFKVDFAPFTSQQEVLDNTDVLIVATGADHALISKKDVERTRLKMIFDLSVPSNVNPNVKEIEGLHLYNIDELSQIVNKAIEARRSEVPVAEAIIDEHFEEFRQWELRRSQYTTRVSHRSAEAVAYMVA